MPESKGSKTTSFLSENVEINGNLHAKGGIRVDGKVKGVLRCDSAIYVGEQAKIEADIATHSLLSSGSIRGRIVAEDTVKIYRPGSVSGEIRTCNLEIEKDVYFNGRCQILRPQNNKHPEPKSLKKPRKAIPERD